MEPEEVTLGTKRVRIQFNPGKVDNVYKIKKLAANFIDLLEDLRSEVKDQEAQRCISLAQTEIETASMYGVKAVTY